MLAQELGWLALVLALELVLRLELALHELVAQRLEHHRPCHARDAVLALVLVLEHHRHLVLVLVLDPVLVLLLLVVLGVVLRELHCQGQTRSPGTLCSIDLQGSIVCCTQGRGPSDG